jgi:hypothetical protein
LIEQLSPPDQRFKVYPLEHITAYSMYLNLKDLFREELEGEDGGDDFSDFFWGFRPRNSEKQATGLSKRRKLMITWDTGSNTILVANASPTQLREIEALIKEYDKEAPADSVRTRRTVLIKIQYSKASAIAEALKEVYRDLLSSKDKEFDQGEQQRRGTSQERVTVIRYGDGSGGGSKRASPVKVGFEGALSVGVDDISNTILISVQEELFQDVVAMVNKLDQEAAPNTVVRVHRVNGNVSAEAIRQTINDAVGKPWIGGKPDPEAGGDRGGRNGRRGDQDRGPGRDRGDRGRRDRDRDRDRDNRDGDRDRDRNNDNDNDND